MPNRVATAGAGPGTPASHGGGAVPLIGGPSTIETVRHARAGGPAGQGRYRRSDNRRFRDFRDVRNGSSDGRSEDASASVEVLEQFHALIPDEWLDSAAYGTPEQCVRKISREYDLGCHSVIMHGASPHELESVVEAYRANRPTLRRAVAANPGKFA